MSFSQIRPYIQTLMTAVDANSWEHVDGFDFNNIPETKIDKAWHLTFSPVSPKTINQNCFQLDYPVVLNVFLLAGRDVASGIDAANVLGQSIYQECLKHSSRLGITGTSSAKVINIIPGSMSVNPLSADNNNTIRLELNFSFQLVLEIS